MGYVSFSLCLDDCIFSFTSRLIVYFPSPADPKNHSTKLVGLLGFFSSKQFGTFILLKLFVWVLLTLVKWRTACSWHAPAPHIISNSWVECGYLPLIFTCYYVFVISLCCYIASSIHRSYTMDLVVVPLVKSTLAKAFLLVTQKFMRTWDSFFEE